MREGSIYWRCYQNPAMDIHIGKEKVLKGAVCGAARELFKANVLERMEAGEALTSIYSGDYETLAAAVFTGDLFFMLLEERGLTIENNQKALTLLKNTWRRDRPRPIDASDIKTAYEGALGVNLDDVFRLVGPGIRNNSNKLTKPIEELLQE